MIELTAEQSQALKCQRAPLQVVNPATNEVYVLIRKDVYDLACGIVGGAENQVWGDEDDGLFPERP